MPELWKENGFELALLPVLCQGRTRKEERISPVSQPGGGFHAKRATTHARRGQHRLARRAKDGESIPIRLRVPPPRSAADNRKIAGVLLSYSWNPFGQLYEIRQGRNHIGAGEIPGEDRRVDVYCPNDTLLSSDHAMILVQDGRFYIEDLASVNGTKVNGEPIHPGRPEPLQSPAEIRVGETVFTFVRFDVSTGAAQVAPTSRVEEKPRSPEPRPSWSEGAGVFPAQLAEHQGTDIGKRLRGSVSRWMGNRHATW